MHSIEIINAVNDPDHVEKTASQIAEIKARAWIRKGVERAAKKVAFQLNETLELASNRGDLTPELRADIEIDIRSLTSKHAIDGLVASAWHRRAGGPAS